MFIGEEEDIPEVDDNKMKKSWKFQLDSILSENQLSSFQNSVC